ncbi:putative nephrocystin-3-like isoform X2 [Capsicum annuum]|nr:putative nephrocystin-3-like isoform X2 [Capsicum annuum]
MSALTLQSLGNLKEAQELLERCLDARRALLPEDHIQIAANLLHLARVKIVKILAPNKLKKSNANQVRAELDMTKDLLSKSISPSLSRFGTENLSNLTQDNISLPDECDMYAYFISYTSPYLGDTINFPFVARENLVPSVKEKRHKQSYGESMTTARSRQSALIILLQSLDALSSLEMKKLELEDSKVGTLKALRLRTLFVDAFLHTRRYEKFCFILFVTEKSLSDAPGVKAEYILCLKHLVDLLTVNKTSSKDRSSNAALQELKDEIKRVQVDLSKKGGRRS